MQSSLMYDGQESPGQNGAKQFDGDLPQSLAGDGVLLDDLRVELQHHPCPGLEGGPHRVPQQQHQQLPDPGEQLARLDRVPAGVGGDPGPQLVQTSRLVLPGENLGTETLPQHWQGDGQLVSVLVRHLGAGGRQHGVYG